MKNVNKTYKTGKIEVKALKNITLNVQNGEFISIIGASGSGKSTLMNIIGCLDFCDSGEYKLMGKNVFNISEKMLCKIRRENIGFIFQKFNLIPTLSAFENVALPLVYGAVEKEKRNRLAQEALLSVGLADRAKHLPSELSGGQQQRVAIARAIVTNPEILLADEPTGNLDSKSASGVMELLKELNQKGRTIVLITHDQKTADYGSRKIIVSDGVIQPS
ncbi:MAG: ABC transporter ATP-binding protein [Clostridia bacterium]|nr:ABC transporter ATP-binding protein [Clostridia bacterium]